MNSLKTDNSISGYLKETKSHSKLIYRLETGYKNISSLKTRPHTQISAFSQTFTNMPSININKEISEIITKPKTQMTIFIPKVKDKLTQVRPPTESSLKTTKLKNRYKRKNLKCISLEKQQNSFDSKKYYDTVLTDTNPQKKNDNLDSSKLEINQLNSIEIPQKSFVGNLMSSLFRQNNLKSVRNFLVSEKESEIKNAREGNKSPSHSPKIFKGPILAQASSHDKELDVYMNVKNYKLSKNIVNSLKKFCEKILLDRSKKSDQIYVESKITEIYSTLLTHLVNLPSMITECVNKRNNREELFISMALMTAELAQTKDFGLYVEGLKLQAKIYKTYGNLNKSLQIYNQAKQLCNKHDLYKLKTKIYKRLGKLYLELQSLRKAKSNFIKTLELSWFVSSKKYELLAYDLLGLIAFYEGSIEKAKYYHNRMINCELEPENSSIRLIAISKIKNKIDLRKNSENNFTLLGNALVSSDEEEVGLYEIKKKEENYEIYLTPNEIVKNRKKGITFLEKQKMMIRQTGSSMFKNRVNNKEDIFSENVMNKIRLRLQKERNMNHLLDKSKKTNIQDVFKNLPQELFKAFIPQEEAEQTDNRKFPTDIMKGLYGVKKSIVLKNSQKMESFKFMKTTSLDKNNFYLSHLSSNRSLDRFSRIFETNQFNKKKLNNEIKLFLDKKTSQKIKKSLMKFKSNILIAISRLEVVKRGKYLTPNQDPLIVRRFGLSMN